MDVIELNEAFAAQALACLRQLGLDDDDPRVNPNGGAIALGHPLGMSGARLLLTAAHELKATGKQLRALHDVRRRGAGHGDDHRAGVGRVPNVFAFDGFIPVVHESAFIHPNATVTGNVVIGRDVYVGPGAAIRGDWGGVIIEDGCNVQENCTIHMFPGVTVVLEASAHIGHGAVVHGARIGRNALVGMNAVVMDRAVVGAESIVGALCFVPAEMAIPPRTVVVGNPARA